jgi:phosphopentomutase
MPPPQPTLLDRLSDAGIPVIAVGKVADLFAGRGVTRRLPTVSDDAGIDTLIAAMRDEPDGLIFVNLVDFDTNYGHRNDVRGYQENLERFDRRLPEILAGVREDDLLVITADHGNDPTTPSTDHSREHVPVLAMCGGCARGSDLGTRETFADVGQTIAGVFGIAPLPSGTSFLGGVCR